jgi:hypothetical protein
MKRLDTESREHALEQNEVIKGHETTIKTAEVKVNENDTPTAEVQNIADIKYDFISVYMICKYPLILFV